MVDRQTSTERAKPFKLVKYFTYTSLILIFIGTVLLSAINIRWARQMQLRKSEEYAQLLIENLNHQVFLQFIIPVALKFGRIRLREKAQAERMDKVVRSTLHSFPVEQVNIYDMKNIISYSYDPNLVGKMNVGGPAFENALAGKSTSKLVQSGSFWEILLGFPSESQLRTFAPIRAEKFLSPATGPVIGVVEIVQDMTSEYRRIFHYQIVVVCTSGLVMVLLFLVLVVVVNRGEKIIEKRAQERLALKEELSKAQHLSSLGEMTAGISHEIRNPLGIIRSSAELLQKRIAALDPSETIPGVIVEEATRLDSIISDFLNYARPKLPQRNPCRVEEIVAKNLVFLEPQLDHHDITVNPRFGDDLPTIAADADMLYQAFLNILINAMQAMENGGQIDIDISANTDKISILFEDTGRWIAPENMNKIWDPFFTTKEKGTGLGLGIVKNIIEAHHGQVAIANKKTHGVQVKIDLPLK